MTPAQNDEGRRSHEVICAASSVRALDNAFFRHGRFDYVIPVGPPDPAAREAIWDRYLAAIPHRGLDMAAIVEESRLLNPSAPLEPTTNMSASAAAFSSASARERRRRPGR